MKVTILITVYNMVKYLESTIQSALRQVPAAEEIVVVDDGSTDGSAEILARYASSLRVVRNETNQGVFLATLRGMEAARGDVICFLDADDLWASHKVGAVRDVFVNDPDVILVSHDYRFMDATGKTVLENDPSQDTMRQLASQKRWAELDAQMRASILEYRGNVWLGSGYSVRRTAFDPKELRRWVASLPKPKAMYQDHPLATFLVLTSQGQLRYVDDKLLFYRVHSESYSTGASSVERALAILHKGEITHRATADLVRYYRPDLTEVIRVQQTKLEDYLYLRSVYERDLPTSLRFFSQHVCRTENRSQWVKEAVRLATCFAFGAKTFFSVKAKFSVALAGYAGR